MPITMTQTQAKPTSNVTDDDRQLKYYRYGWRQYRFDGFLSRPLTAYIVLCICTFTQNFSVNGANNAVISTLERVFYLDSVRSGLFLALYDLATVFSSPIIGYLGCRYSSPMFFSLNMIVVGIGNILIASSNFVHHETKFNFDSDIAQQVSLSNNVHFQCYKDPLNEANVTDISCLSQQYLSNTFQYAKFLLYLGNFVNGIGSVALFTIGISYIERIFPREKAAYCQAIYFAVGTIGGALGIIVTGRFLQLFTKLTVHKQLPSWLTPSHPLWIGCWWLPYIIYGSLCFAIGLFVSGLPNFEKPMNKHSPDMTRTNRSEPVHSISTGKHRYFLDVNNRWSLCHAFRYVRYS
jgi:solute carrier organic anion transporter family, member 4A